MARRASTKGLVAGSGDDEIGKLLTFSITDEPKSATKLLRTWAAAGLDTEMLPKTRQGFHIFMSACRSVEMTRKPGQRVEIKVDEVVNDDSVCTYQITRMVRDRDLSRIDHTAAMTLCYDKAQETITVTELEDYEAMRGLEDQVRKHYEKNAKTIPGQKIRNAIRETLVGIGAQNMRRKAGGLYFVPHKVRQGGREKSTAPVLKGLQQAIEDLYGERGDCWTIGLSRRDDQGMVAKHFAINVASESQAAMEKALNRVRQGQGSMPVRQDLLSGLFNERRRLAGAIAQFEEIVNLEKSTISKNMRDLDNALGKLQDLADKGAK